MADFTIRNAIAVLPPEIASQIAAGEVVERPASVVKELVENALDAQATRIDITLEDGGKQLILVEDNGWGMTTDEALMAVQRHATSKISSAQDLFQIHTYGFRGEAIPSIASVSEFELITKTESQQEGTRLLITGGILQKQESAARTTGTTIRVSRLFDNVPARQKFLKATQTELARCMDFVQRLALARPETAFTLRHATQENFVHPGGDTLSALVAVFGRQVTRELIPVSVDSHIRLRAYIAPPTRTRPNRSQQYFFVNGRPIANRSLSHALDEAYSGMLPHGRYAVAVVLIDVDPELVDVNVHPRKAEVKFIRDREVHSAVFHAVRDSLIGKGLVPRVAPSSSSAQPGTPAPSFTFDPVPASVSQFIPGDQENQSDAPLQPSVLSEVPPVPMEQQDSRHIADLGLDPSEIRILGQIANTYIVAETREGMAIIDQHVAHERVLYERFRKRAFDRPVQMLAIPITLELSRRESLIVKERMKEFIDLGFVLEEFGVDTFLIRGVPADVRQNKLEETLRDMMEDVVELTVQKKILAPREAVVTSAACKAAVKAGDRMSEPEMRGLIAQLLLCDNPYVCPHGRPIIVKLDHTSLEKIFQR